MKLELLWSANPLARRRKRFDAAQDYIDETCAAKMSEYVPVALPIYNGAGKLRDSVEIEEPGHIIYTASYAEHQYYDELDHSASGNPKATRLWFETMKQRYVHEILGGAQSILTKGRKK